MDNKLTVEQFGAKVKAKYPQYASLSDTEVGQKTLDIYPEYKAKVNTQPVVVKSTISPESTNIQTQLSSDIGEAASSGVSKFATGFKQTLDAGKTGDFALMGRGVLNELGGGLEAAFSPITGTLATASKLPIIKQGIDLTKQFIINPASNTISDYKPLHDFMTKYPNADEVAGNLITIGLALSGMKNAPEVGSAVKGGVDAFSTAVESAKRTTGETMGNIKTGVVDTSGNIINKVSSSAESLLANKIPEQVKTALGETGAKTFETYSQIAQDAAKSYKNQTPLEYSGTRAQTALDTIQRKLDNIGTTKSDVLNKAQVANKPVGNIVTKFRQQINNLQSSKTTVGGDTNLLQTINSEAQKLGSNPSALQVDKFIDFVQEQIYTSKKNLTVPVTDATTGALRQYTGQLNESLKTKLPESYRNLNAQYSDLIGIRNDLNTKLGYEGEKGGALMKRVFSPSDAGTKKLFADVKTITGIDLVNEATIARYVMETMGDSRQASMLQQLQLPSMAPLSILKWAKDWIAQSVNTPEAQLKRASTLTAPSQIREAQ